MTPLRRMLLGASIVLAAAAPCYSQQAASYKIPRRVYFAPIAVAQDLHDPTLKMIPDYLYTAISALQPIVRVDTAAKAASVVRVSVSTPGPSVVVRVMDKGVEAAKVSFVATSFSDVAQFVQKAARELAPKLGMVEPVVEQTGETGQATGNQALIQKVQLADKFARPIELSLEGPSLLRAQASNNLGGMSIGVKAVPVVFHFAYYVSRSLGIEASLLGYYGSFLSFGRPQTTVPGPYTQALLILPGIGLKYRSLGTIFASFTGSFYAGYGHVKNISSQALGSYSGTGFQVFLNPGASASIFYVLLRFASDFGYNISPQLAAHLGVAMDLNPLGIGGSSLLGYPTDGNSFFLQYLTVGLSYRP